jgi:NAD(P)-dependent dehydrogenase (short-subunit alcohol dehydrogenase family)
VRGIGADPVDQAVAAVAVRAHEQVGDHRRWRRPLGDQSQTAGDVRTRPHPVAGGLQDHPQQLPARNSEAVFLGTREAIRVMKAQDPRGGSIVNISSIAGLVGIDNLAAYNASKGAVRLFTKSAALHVAKQGYGIRINSVHPSYTWTPMVQHLGDNTGDRDAFFQALAQVHPLGRPGEPMDIAYGVLYLASDEAVWVTGSELVIDGGITAA